MAHCTNCPNLQAEVLAQRGQITRLQIEVAMLQRIIADAQAECVALESEANRKQRGHVPTGVWAYAQGQKDTAEKVLERLRG